MSLDAKTADARSKTLNNSSGRWSIDHGKGLEDLYANAGGSIYTAMGGPLIPGGTPWDPREPHGPRALSADGPLVPGPFGPMA